MRVFIFILHSPALGCCTASPAASTPAGRRLGSAGGAGQDASQRCPNLNIKRERGHVQPVLRIRIRDPVPFRPLDPGWVKNQDQDPG